MPDLKLIAFDAEDLAILSAHLQDAVLKAAEMAYLPKENRFALLANRFDWEEAVAASQAHRKFHRRRTALRFERVLDAQFAKLDLAAKNECLSLLAIEFEAGEPPEGFVVLYFAGGGAIRLKVECIEAEMADLGAAWSTPHKPDHAAVEADGTS